MFLTTFTSENETETNRDDTGYVLGAVLYAVCAVSMLQVTGSSVGVENTQVFWTINACRGTTTTTHVKDQNTPVIFNLILTHMGVRTG